MNEVILSLGLTQVVLPLALIIAHAVVPSLSRSGLVLRAAALFILLMYLALAGLWLFPPWWTPYLMMLALLAATVFRLGRMPEMRRRWLAWAERGAAVLVGAGAALLLASAIAGRTVPGDAVDLAMPLGPGRYLVVSGGSTDAVNAHLFTLTADRARAFRGQSYGVDIIGISRSGLRATGAGPVDPAAYTIYGAPVIAPCAGQVAMVIDGVPDMPVPQMDRANMTGNSVVLDCGGAFVLLAHLAPGSVAVREGQAVGVGAPIGQVGNSGNTGEPHLHIHVQDALPTIDPMSAQPLWFTVNGRFLVRNDRFVLR